MERQIRDELREEYFQLLPDVCKVLEEIEARIRYAVIPAKKKLRNHERIEIHSRVKECERAINALERRQEGRIFDRSLRGRYTLHDLKDLAGVRVLVFPTYLMNEVDREISQVLKGWKPDPIKRNDSSGEDLAFKYHGYIDPKISVCGEYQIVPMLVGLFWEIEHAAFYEPTPTLKGIEGDEKMLKRRLAVYTAFNGFENRLNEIVTRADKEGYY